MDGNYELKYEAMRAQIAADISSGLKPHEPLPSERKLMATYGVSRMTVRRALALLVDDGLVYSRRGSGTYVADPAMISKSLSLTSFSEDVRERGMTPGARSQQVRRLPAEADVAADLALSPGAPVVHLERVRTADGLPLCIEEVWLPADLVPANFAEGAVTSLYDTLSDLGIEPEMASQTIRATVVNVEQATQLDVAPHSAAFSVSRTTYAANARPIERAHSLYRADRYDFTFSIHRGARS
ncbi:transcriptional regulator, GntR family [Sanguibacter gelidistatuariae]|uniref:Transcriptional regulator, GntR family n=1 Tax=Sanguibacter gelidistatuariae TaxID=1814289 RepID=A0A1G6HDT2_9MICO|nr:GntR family transcriptional regulator [Sanguibacter gelidistatuariae]SDB92248.1 transcriptional regulator, GntR family [Sanguibacter gelidistatuariae]